MANRNPNIRLYLRHTVVSLVFLLSILPLRLYAEEPVKAEIQIDFPINEYRIVRDYSNNAHNLRVIELLFEEVAADSTLELMEVSFRGSASPDGGQALNSSLAASRVESLRRWVVERGNLPDSIIGSVESTIPWEAFREMLRESDWSLAPDILAIIALGDDSDPAAVDLRLRKLRSLDGGRAWRVLASDYFPRLRLAYVVFLKLRYVGPEEPEAIVEEVVEEEPVETPDTIASEPVVIPEELPLAHGCRRFWSVRTNLPALGMFIANASAEWQFACRWSASASLYYSAWNYLKSTRKFRTFSFRPELRYWLRPGGNGFFVDAHLAMVSYNYALSSGEWRYQDRGGVHPALGGGLGLGFRLPLSHDGRWRAEASAGVGVYSLDYNRFYNEPNGKLYDTVRKTFVGLDHFAISLVFTFNSRGGREQ